MPEFIDQSEITQFYKEIEVLSQLRHVSSIGDSVCSQMEERKNDVSYLPLFHPCRQPNIVSMFGYCKKDGFLCLVTQYIRGGDLSKGLTDPSKKLDLKLQTEFALAIAAGMIYLHKNNIIHRDLKVNSKSSERAPLLTLHIPFFFCISRETFWSIHGRKPSCSYVISVCRRSSRKPPNRPILIRAAWSARQPMQRQSYKTQITITTWTSSVLQ
jgi:serine/threonine protein kinase